MANLLLVARTYESGNQGSDIRTTIEHGNLFSERFLNRQPKDCLGVLPIREPPDRQALLLVALQAVLPAAPPVTQRSVLRATPLEAARPPQEPADSEAQATIRVFLKLLELQAVPLDQIEC